jgi:hypothetical protein
MLIDEQRARLGSVQGAQVKIKCNAEGLKPRLVPARARI